MLQIHYKDKREHLKAIVEYSSIVTKTLLNKVSLNQGVQFYCESARIHYTQIRIRFLPRGDI